MRKIKWYLKQLFPLVYRSHYKDIHEKQHFAVWQMWFGKVFNYDHFVVCECKEV